MSDDIYCRTCGEALTRDGCPNRIGHATAIRFVPDQRGAPSRPGPGPDTLKGTGKQAEPLHPETRNEGSEP